MILRKKSKGKKKKNVVKITVIDEEAQAAALAEGKNPESTAAKESVLDADKLNSVSAPKKKSKKAIQKEKRRVLDEIDKEETTEETSEELISEEQLAQAAEELEGAKKSRRTRRSKKSVKETKKAKKLSKQEEKLAASIVNLTDKLSALEQEEEILSPQPKPKLYKKIALFFSVFVLLLVGIIAYYSLVSVDIVIVPAQEQVSNNLIIDVYDQQSAKNSFSDTAIGGMEQLFLLKKLKLMRLQVKKC
jgi:lipopolysaccharide export LptBFGC system permease protein LptF